MSNPWENNAAGTNASYLSPTPEEFPIIASSPFAMSKIGDTPTLTINDIQQLIDCGFNVGMESANEKLLNKILALIPLARSTFKFMPASPNLHNDNYKTFLSQYKSNKYIGGWDFSDEPPFDQLENIRLQYERIRTDDSYHLVYINLLGGKGNDMPDEMEYEDYLNHIQTLFAPGLWSYDLYPITINNESVISVRYRIFYRDLQLFSKMAAKTHRPFWAYVQSMAYTRTETKIGCPPPKEEYIRYEAFSALAFGAQGIVYWTYAQRNNPSSGVETYSTALIDINGEKTKYWYYAQKVNNEIRKFAPIFLGSKLVSYAHIGNLGTDESGVIMPPTSIGSFGPVSMARTLGIGALFTIIENDEDLFLIIVNHSPLEDSTFDIQFSDEYITWDLTNCKEEDFSDATLQSTLPIGMALQAGAYRIYQFMKR